MPTVMDTQLTLDDLWQKCEKCGGSGKLVPGAMSGGAYQMAFVDSEELVTNSKLPSESLVEVGTEHRLADPESLAAMLGACVSEQHSIIVPS
jgi:hypothetical protein